MKEPYFTDTEHRILLAAMGRELKLCRELDKEATSPDANNLEQICNSINNKIYQLQHPRKDEVAPHTTDCIKEAIQIFKTAFDMTKFMYSLEQNDFYRGSCNGLAFCIETLNDLKRSEIND